MIILIIMIILVISITIYSILAIGQRADELAYQHQEKKHEKKN